VTAVRPAAGAVELRRATAADAVFIAEMIDLSNAGGDRSTFDVALANVLVEGSDVGFANAVIVEAGGTPVAAMVVNAPLRPYESLDHFEPSQLPFETLKASAPGMLYLRNIAVLPDFRGMGMASILMTVALNMADLCKAAGLCAIVHRHNGPMHKLVKAHGLAVTATGFLPSHPQFPGGVELDLWCVPIAR
jgi:ribosomal protein S18 acetylase RimI-like enzyme